MQRKLGLGHARADSFRRSVSQLAVIAALPLLFAPAAQATLITTGNINPGNLATVPTTTSQIIVGFGGVTSTLTVNADATGNGVTAITGNFAGSVSAVAGSGAGNNGTITVIGNGTAGSASFTGSRSLQFGTTGGTGILSIQAGGLMQALGAGDNVTLGNSNSTGTGTVDGAGSNLKSAGRINVGSFSNSSGSLGITNGGVVQNTGNGALGVAADLAIGAAEGASGSVTVAGAGSQLLTNGILVGSGETSTASLTIQNGGFARSTVNGANLGSGLSIGSLDSASVTVTGLGSTLEIGAIGSGFLAGKEVVIGGFAAGSLLVDQSATINAGSANFLVGGGLFGTQTEAGIMTVRNGATVNADTVLVQQGGVLNGGGGTINGDVTLAGGTVAPGNSPGTTTVNGDLNLLDGTLELEIGSILSDAFVVSGNVVLGADLLITLIFLDPPPPGAEIDIASFFSGAAAIDFTAFDLAAQLAATGLGAGEGALVRLGDQSVAVNGSAVPVPASLALLLSALAGLGLVRRRQV